MPMKTKDFVEVQPGLKWNKPEEDGNLRRFATRPKEASAEERVV
jgi:hypothetical protein